MILAVTNTFIPNTTIRSAEVNENFSDIISWANGGIGADNLDVFIEAIVFNVSASEALDITSSASDPAIDITKSGTASALLITNTASAPAIDIVQSSAQPGLRIAKSANGPVIEVTHSGAASQADASALTVNSTTKGILLPRVTTTQRLAITNPVEGLTVYDTDLGTYTVYANSSWKQLTVALPGTMIDFGGIDILQGYLACDGSAASRTTYIELFNALTSVRSATRSNGNPQITGMASTTNLRIGMAVEGTGFTAVTIASVDSATQVTLSGNATGSGVADYRFFAHGNGDASTTFTLPDSRRRVTVGAGGSGTATLGSGLGNTGGEETHALTTAELATHNHTASASSTSLSGTVQVYNDAGGAGAFPGVAFNNGHDRSQSIDVLTAATHSHTITVDNNGSGTAHNNIQPSLVVMKLIKT